MAPDFDPAGSKLIADLCALSQQSPKLVRSSVHPAPAVPQMEIETWKLAEHKLSTMPSLFPTFARALFSTELPSSGGTKRYRIVARGYDKFFNIGEVPWTTWAALEMHTKTPYALTLKSNGCVILVAALTPSQLLVTSKHSLKLKQGKQDSNAQVGERWLRKHLEDAGKTVEDLARTLWDRNWTAVAELCDDDFEEHVIPYSTDKAGLHLHGLNNSCAEFVAQPPDAVATFAREWGFIETQYVTLPSLVREFADDAACTGIWRGEPVEGFVVRSTVAEPRETAESHKQGRPPYSPGSPALFFKVKFDQPYMMYRDWREITKTILAAKDHQPRVSRANMQRPETQLYVRWVTREIRRDASQFKKFRQGKWVLKTRERFLEWLETEEGKNARRDLAVKIEQGGGVEGERGDARGNEDDAEANHSERVVIIPVGIPGCGKTAVSVALAHLLGFDHIQSDDGQGRKSALSWIRSVTGFLEDGDVVIADKNNHLRQHRQTLRDATKSLTAPVRLIALNWALDLPAAAIHRVCSDRLLARGSNHQTLRADAATRRHETILWHFIEKTEPLAEGEADAVIEMDLEESLEEAVARAAREIARALELPSPSVQRMGEALALARAYKPTVRPEEESQRKKEDKRPSLPQYFGILAEVDLQNALARALEDEADTVPAQLRELWVYLKKQNRVAKRPHVTVVHSRSLPGELDLWDRCGALWALDVPPLFRFRLGSIVADKRVMAVTVEELEVDAQGGDSEGSRVGRKFVATLPEEVRNRLHVTVGTQARNISAVEAKALVQEWREGEKGDGVVELSLSEGFWVKGRLKGLFD